MDTNKYQIFLKVLEHRSFSKAAAELGYTQSAVSHSIAVMEKEFGFQLLNRKDNKISLTRAGIDLLPHIRNVASAQDELDLSLQSYRGIESGTLCIASIMSLPMHFSPSFSGASTKSTRRSISSALTGTMRSLRKCSAEDGGFLLHFGHKLSAV